MIKPQEEQIRGAGSDVALAHRHMNRVKRVSWSLRDEKALLCRQHMVMQSPEIPDMAASAFGGSIGLPATWSDGAFVIGTLSATRVAGGGWLLEAALAAAEPFFGGLFLCFFLGSGTESIQTLPDHHPQCCRAQHCTTLA